METLDTLTSELKQWAATARDVAPEIDYHGSADDVLLQVLANRYALDEQASWLERFIRRWEECEALEKVNRDDEKRFQEWRSNRQWFHDLRDFTSDESAVGPGYGYPCGFVMLNTTSDQKFGRYWTACPFDVWGDLEHVERALWEQHARHEVDALADDKAETFTTGEARNGVAP